MKLSQGPQHREYSLTIEEFEDAISDANDSFSNGSEEEDKLAVNRPGMGSIDILPESSSLTTKINSILELIQEKTFTGLMQAPKDQQADDEFLRIDVPALDDTGLLLLKLDNPDIIEAYKYLHSPLIMLKGHEINSSSTSPSDSNQGFPIFIDKGTDLAKIPSHSPIKNLPNSRLEYNNLNCNRSAVRPPSQNNGPNRNSENTSSHFEINSFKRGDVHRNDLRTHETGVRTLLPKQAVIFKLDLTSRQSEIEANEMLFRSKISHSKRTLLTNLTSEKNIADVSCSDHKTCRPLFTIANQTNSAFKDDINRQKLFQGNYELMQYCLVESAKHPHGQKTEANSTNQSVSSSTKEVGRSSLISGSKCSDELAKKCKSLFQNMMSLSSGGSLESQYEVEINSRSTWLYQNIEPAKNLQIKSKAGSDRTNLTDANQKLYFEKTNEQSDELNRQKEPNGAFAEAHSVDSFQYIQTATLSRSNSQEFKLCSQTQSLSKSISVHMAESQCESHKVQSMNLFMVNSLLDADDEDEVIRRRLDELMMREMRNQTMKDLVTQEKNQPEENSLHNYASIQFQQQIGERDSSNCFQKTCATNPIVKIDIKMNASDVMSNSDVGDDSLAASNLDILSFKESCEQHTEMASDLPRFTLPAKQSKGSVCIMDANQLPEDSEIEQSFRESQVENDFSQLVNRHNSRQNIMIERVSEKFNSNYFAKKQHNSDFFGEDVSFDSSRELTANVPLTILHPSEFAKTKKSAFSVLGQTKIGNSSHRQSIDEPTIVVGSQSGVLNDSFKAISSDS